jgi:hemoglobin/transferrin/lactoferrin receptor protein
LLLPAVLTLLAGVASADGNAHDSRDDASSRALSEVVVVATKRAASIRNVAADVSVIDTAELRSTLSTSIADALRFVPGVTHESSGSRFGADGISIRGIGGNRIAVELDGVPLSHQFDVGNFSNATRDFADTGLVEQVEILRGPASALYGGSALGGVVAMRTLSPAGGAGSAPGIGSAGALYKGNDASRHVHASTTFDGPGTSLVVGGSFSRGNERQSAAMETPADRQAFERRAVMLKVVGENSLGHRWQISAFHQDRDVLTQVTSVLGSDRFRSTTRLEGDDAYSSELVSAEYDFSSGWLTDGVLRVFAADTDVEQHTVDLRAAATLPASINRAFFYDQRRHGIELNLWRDQEIRGWTHRFGAGLEFTESRTSEMRDGRSTSLVDGDVSSDILGESFPLRDFPITRTREAGAYISDEIDRGVFSLLLGLRFDANRLDPVQDPVYLADNPSTSVVGLSNSDFSPKIGTIYHLGDDVDIYFQYARGFRAPPFEDANIGLDIPLFNIRAIPNPDLKSETSDGWELGLRWHRSNSQLQFGAFRTDYRDFIETRVRVGIDPASGRLLFQSRNIGGASISGLEARWIQQLTGQLDGVTVHASAYVAEGKNADTGQALNSVGPAEAVLGATWRSRDERSEFRALLSATAAWTKRDETAGELFKPAGHAVLDIFYSQAIGERLTVRASVGNVTDRIYWRWSEIRGLSPTDVLLPTLAESGRHYSIGLQWNW